MRRAQEGYLAMVLIAGVAVLVGGPRLARAQSGGTIEATVTYAGPAQIETLKINKDTAECGTEARIEKIVIGAHMGLENAVVSVDGVKGAAATRKVEIDQHGCKFVPHVVAMTPGEIEFKNSDGILHNLHTYSSTNSPINKAQPRFKKTMTERFDKPGIVKLTCDVHSWMVGWVDVLPTPFFGVTDANGMTKIENVPAGKHTVEVWQEALGTQSKEVEIQAGHVTKVVFAMKKK